MTKWVDEGRKYIGLKEIVGKGTNLTIQFWLSTLRAAWRDDETPWCGLFVAFIMKSLGYPIPVHWYRALAWLSWGVDIGTPCYGCIVIFTRIGGGHVGIVVGKTKDGRLMVLGGNQKNMVSIAPFDLERVAGYRMPIGTFHRGALPVLTTNDSSSKNEA
jgi:uncharacterized protein (TIGR02594 family)